MEHLTPEQLEAYDLAVNVAYAANDTFDMRQEYAAAIGNFIGDGESNEVDLIASFDAADAEFTSLEKAASLLMPRYELFDAPAPENEPLMSEEVRSAMTIEQRLKAAELAPIMADHFKEYGVTPDSLRVVMTEAKKGGEKVFTIVHTGNGIDIGNSSKDYDKARSYNSVMSNKNNDRFAVPLTDKTYDARKGMTSAVYDALYADAKDSDTTLPDSKAMAKEHDDLWSWTMLTGEPLTAADGGVRFRYVHDDVVCGYFVHPGSGNRALRVRPAVVIE